MRAGHYKIHSQQRAVQSPGAADKRSREPPKAARTVRAAYRWIEPVDRPEFSSNTSRQRPRLERQIDGTCTESAVVMFAARQGEAARPPDVSGRNGAPVETQIERLDRNGDSFSSKFNDRNVSPAGLRGTADKEHMSGADGMQTSTRPGSRGGRSYGGAGLVARRAPRGGSSIRSCAVRERRVRADQKAILPPPAEK